MDNSETPISTHQERTLGERSSIRPFDAENPGDVQALLQICQSSESQKWLEELPQTEAEIKDWIVDPGNKSRLYAVSGSPVHVGIGQVGEVQGFIYIYPSGPETSKNLVTNNLMSDEEFKSASKREVSYGLRPGAVSLQIASALRQAITADEGDFVPRGTYPSEKIIYLAFTNPENTNSEHVLQSSGFENTGSSKYDSKSDSADNVWRLNPDKLDQLKLSRLISE